MKKLITLFAAFTFSAATTSACPDQLHAVLTPAGGSSYVNVSGTGGTSLTFFVDLSAVLDSWAPDCNSSSVSFDVKLDLMQGFSYHTQTFSVGCGSYNTGMPCTGVCPTVHSYMFGGNPGQPDVLVFNIPNQTCGQYTVRAEIRNVTLINPPSPREITVTNVGGNTTSCNLNTSTTCVLGDIMIVNFSGTGGLAASMSSTVACNGNNGTATITPSGGSSPYTYSWVGTSSTASTATSLAPGTYTATATDANGCAVSGATTVGHLSFTLTPGSQTVCLDQCLLLAANVSSSGSYTVTWTQSIGTGGTTTIGTGDEICVRPTSLSRTSPTVNTYTATVTNGAGCTLTQSITITVNPNCTVAYYNGCCTDPDARVTSTTETQQSTSLSVSPNPATQETNIAFDLPGGNGSIEIYSADGRLVQRIDGIHDSGTVNLTTGEFAAGIYSVILISDEVQVRTEKLVITE